MRNAAIMMIALFATTEGAFASSSRVIDAQQINNAGATLSLPSSSTTIVGRDTTDTLTNKTLTAPAISSPTGLVKGDVGLGNVDNTSDATKNAATATLTNKTIDGGSNTFTSIPAATALSGQVGVPNGGTGLSTLTSGSVLVGAGASSPSLVAPGTSGNVLTSNGSTWVSSAVPASAPGVTGTRASPTSVTAGGGVSFSGANYMNIAFIQGSGGAVTVSASPQIAAGSAVGQRLELIGRSATNTVTLADGTGLSLNGSIVLGLDSALELMWDGTNWLEISRR